MPALIGIAIAYAAIVLVGFAVEHFAALQYPLYSKVGKDLIRLDAHMRETIMRKTFAILATVAATLTSTIGMAREGQRTFEHDGQTYVYTSTFANDRQVISGRRYPAGAPFRLVVRNGRVSGTAGGVPVSFKVAEAAGVVRGTQLAAR